MNDTCSTNLREMRIAYKVFFFGKFREETKDEMIVLNEFYLAAPSFVTLLY